MKKFIISISCLFVLLTAGCSNNYERSTESGSLKAVQLPEMEEKMANGDTFMMLFSQTNCSHCKKFKEDVLSGYIVNHEIEVFDVVFDKQDSMDPIFAFIKENPNPSEFLTEDMSAESPYTPTFYFIEKGKVKDIWIGEMSEERFDNYVQKYRLDEVKG